MTCIVAVKTPGGVLLGGDSAGSNGTSGGAYRAPKVFRLSPELALGYTSSFRMGQLLQHHLTVPALRGDELTWAIRDLVPVIRETLKSHGYAHVQHNEEYGGFFLLAVRDRLLLVQSDYSVLETRSPYDAAGSGENYALGAMHALWNRKPKTEPRAFLKAALEAASEYAAGVGPPYNFTSTSRSR